MHITKSTLEKALFRIIREHQLNAYDSISLRELRELWGFSGLRYDDLRDALRVMFESNFVDFVNEGDGLAIVLKPEGYARAQELDIHIRTLLRDAQDKIALYRAAQRGPSRVSSTEPLQERREHATPY